MPIRTADAEWHGTLREGRGVMRLSTQATSGEFTWNSRFSDGGGTNPEEMVGAAHAGCFSMALAGDLGNAGFKPELVRTSVNVHIEKLTSGWEITLIELTTGAKVPGVDNATFQKIAEGTMANCPVSKALKSVRISLSATLA